MNCKKLISLVLMFILVASVFVIAEEAAGDSPDTGEVPAEPEIDIILKAINQALTSSTPPVAELVSEPGDESKREPVFTGGEIPLTVNEAGNYYWGKQKISPQGEKKINELIASNQGFKGMVDAAKSIAKTTRGAEEEKVKEKIRKTVERGERDVTVEVAAAEGIEIPKGGLSRSEISKAVTCYHNPLCEGTKLSDRDAGELLGGIALTWQKQADALFFDKKELSEQSSFEGGSRANVKGIVYTYTSDSETWVRADDQKEEDVLTTDDIKERADFVEGPGYKDAAKKAEEAQEQAKAASDRGTIWQAMDSDVYNCWVKGRCKFGEYAGGIISGLNSLGSYRSLSNALFPDATKDGWFGAANNEALDTFSDLPAFAAQAYCEDSNQKSVESPGQSSVFYRTRAGTYQFVGSIQAERSPSKSFILCERNDDPESNEEFVCPGESICVNGQFCYENEDAEEPLKGTFHKITWRVTAPSDESFTPYIDENGVAIKFNLELFGPSGSVLVFKRLGAADDSVIELNNGNTDGGTITKYLPEEYNRVCIIFNKNHPIRGRFDDNAIPSEGICSDFKPLSAGEVEYGGSNRQVSVTTSSAEVEFNI